MTKTARIGGSEYVCVYEFDLADVFKRSSNLSWWRLALLIVSILVLGFLGGILVGRFFGKIILSIDLLILLPVIACIFLLHEAIHGLFFWIYGGKPSFGVKVIGGWKNFLWGFALYATADAFYTRTQYFIIGLSPLVLITLAAVTAYSFESLQSYAIFAGCANAFGAAGDIYMTAKLRKFSPSVLVRDTADGYEVYERATGSSTDASSTVC